MKLVFNDWVLTLVRDKSPRQWDSNEPFEVVGVPDGWMFKLYLAVCDNMDVIDLEKTDDSVYTSLKKEQLSFAGDYRFQLEGVNGETIRHTNIIHLNVPYSLDGDTHWPELPTAFRDALDKAETLASTAVRYEWQELNTEQQLQARENIGAEPLYGGLIRREISHANIFGLDTTSVFYTEQGSISPLLEDVDVETKNQYALLMSMITGELVDAKPSQWLKTAQMIINFYKSDIISVPVIAYSSVNRTVGLSVTRTGSVLVIRHFSTGSFNHVAYYDDEKDTFYDNIVFRDNVCALSYNVNNDLSTSGLNVPEPSKDTQPTPKSYVDKKVAEAVAAAGGHGLTLQTLTYTYVGSQQTRDVYIEKGSIAQPADDAADDIKTAFNYFCAYMTSETAPADLKGYQRLCSFAITILDAGLISKDLCFYESPGRNMMFRIVELGSNYQITKRNSTENPGIFIAYYDIANKTFLDQGTVSINVRSTSYNTDAPTVKTLKVNTPTDSLHATNKEYVDSLVADARKHVIFEFTLNKDRTITFDQYDGLKNALESGMYVLLKEKSSYLGRSSPLFTMYHESSYSYPRYYFSRIIWTLNDKDLKYEEIMVRFKEPSSNYSMEYDSNIIIPQSLCVGKEADGTYKVDLSVDYERRFGDAYSFLASVVSDTTYGSVVCRFYPKGLDDLDSVILHLSGDYVSKSIFEFIGTSDTTLYKLTVDLDSNIAVTETPLHTDPFYIFDASIDETTGAVATDATFEEIQAQHESGKRVIAKVFHLKLYSTTPFYLPLTYISTSSKTARFETTWVFNSFVSYIFALDVDFGIWSFWDNKIGSQDWVTNSFVPKTIGTDYSGKYLKVDDDGNINFVPAPTVSADRSLGLTSAAVGQLAKITAVDANGKPTAWESVDMPSGGGDGKPRVIKTIHIDTEEVNSIYFSTDDDGNAFELKNQISIRMYGATKNTGSESATLFFRAGNGTVGDIAQSGFPVRANSHQKNYIFDMVITSRRMINMWCTDFAFGRNVADTSFSRYVSVDVVSDEYMVIREIKICWNLSTVFFPLGVTIIVEGF